MTAPSSPDLQPQTHDTMNAKIDALFNLLDEWRCLPKYQLERRANIFFAL